MQEGSSLAKAESSTYTQGDVVRISGKPGTKRGRVRQGKAAPVRGGERETGNGGGMTGPARECRCPLSAAAPVRRKRQKWESSWKKR